jgi:glutathione-regulated potassium-efflux system ancillary protein KefG
MRQFLRPIEQTAALCGMSYAEPFVVHGALKLDESQGRAEARRFVERLNQIGTPGLTR